MGPELPSAPALGRPPKPLALPQAPGPNAAARRYAIFAVAAIGLSYVAGWSVSRAKAERRLDIPTLERTNSRYGRLFRLRLQRESGYLGLSTLPCLVAFKERHPTARMAAGAVEFLVESSAGHGRIRQARPASGNVDAAFAECTLRVWEWTTADYPFRPENHPAPRFWLSVPFQFTMPATYPPLPVGWQQPERWLDDDLVESLSPAWSPIMRTDLARRIAARRANRPSRRGVLIQPLEIQRVLPVFFEEIYPAVFSKAAGEHYRQTSCARHAQLSGGYSEVLNIRVDVNGGVVTVGSDGLANGARDPRFEECLLNRIGLRAGSYFVPGEEDASLRISWPTAEAPLPRLAARDGGVP